MIKKRVIPILLLKSGELWKSIQFGNMKNVGLPKTAARVYSHQEADELALINISDDSKAFDSLVESVNEISKEFSVPLTVGGGIRNFDHVEQLFQSGADKILLNSVNYENFELLNKTASIYGVQSTVVCIDVRLDENGEYVIYSNRGINREPVSLKNHIKASEDNGAGEFFIQSIDRDGVMQGIDNKLGEIVVGHTKRPVILAGGVGNYSHLEETFKSTSCSGIACASIFHFTDSNPLRAYSFLANASIEVKRT